jgi:hypothetical protein
MGSRANGLSGGSLRRSLLLWSMLRFTSSGIATD